MPTFIDKFIEINDVSFKGMRQAAIAMLPKDKYERNKLYEELNRGKCVLDDEMHLNMYLHSYGQMHQAKLQKSFECLPNIEGLFQNEIEIYDWGCGQGIATICLLDYLSAHQITPNIRNINLIEPSEPAILRAKNVISYFDKKLDVRTICKRFDDLEKNDFAPTFAQKIHLFSNILDVEFFDLAEFTHLFQTLFFGQNFFVCVGPYYYNNKRVDDFIAAIEPDNKFVNFAREKGMWKNNWSISLNVFDKYTNKIDEIHDIRKRIEESHKKDQFFAGYILDAVSEEIQESQYNKQIESLYHALSCFDVKSNYSLDINQPADAEFSVLANIVSRGLPTKAPISVENIFADFFHISIKPQENQIIKFKSDHKLNAESINEALHIIDPRFNTDYYNGDMLGTSFSKEFFSKYLNFGDHKYLAQILEPQRTLSSIIDIPNKTFKKDQLSSFAFEIPYGNFQTGFIYELNKIPQYSNIFCKSISKQNNRYVSKDYNTYDLSIDNARNLLTEWKKDYSANKYLTTLKRNAEKQIEGKWKDTLQVVLSPIAIARIERILLQAILAKHLDCQKKEWHIAVIERDVPCAAIAIKNLQESFEQLTMLDGRYNKLPDIEFDIVSTKEFKDSPLHLNKPIYTTIPNREYDACIDISILLRDNIDALPLDIKCDAIYLIRSSHYQKKERTICTAKNIVYPPCVHKDTSGHYINIIEKEKCLTYFLNNIFRKPSFRHGQIPIISHALNDKTTIGLLPTGGGKSLTYQLSCILQPGVSIVIDPLVSLIIDQIKGLKALRIDACDCIKGGLRATEKAERLNRMQNGSVLFMLLSPERFMMEDFRESLISMTEDNHVYFAYGIIDEVHCVSEWGHDFRTSYLHLGRNMINFMHTQSGRPLSIIGLTATASFDVLADVERELTLGGNLTIDSDTIVRSEDDIRPELTYRIIKIETDFSELKDKNEPYILNIQSEWDLKNLISEYKKLKALELLSTTPQDLEVLNQLKPNCSIPNFSVSQFYNADKEDKYPNAGLLFCPHKIGAFGVRSKENLKSKGWSTFLREKACEKLALGSFVGGDNPDGDMSAFINNKLNMIVATKAFGMGIDKPNIRYVIHVNHPSSIESYVQEAGRGGRDKKNSISYILYDSSEYIYLKPDIIQDIKNLMGNERCPIWLDKYRFRFVLMSDFKKLCQANGCSIKDTTDLENIIRQYNFTENVDKNINLWFHNNSFRGLYKEKVMLLEMTDRILNVKPSFLLQIQGKLREETGNEDVVLKVDVKKNAIKLVSETNISKQYGYIFLTTLSATYEFIDFIKQECIELCQHLIEILKSYDDYSAKELLKPIQSDANEEEGIYSAMSKADDNGYVYITVSWENQVLQDFEGFKFSIEKEITQIAENQSWYNFNRKGRSLNFKKINEFEDLIFQIASLSEDDRWLRYHANQNIYAKLKHLFCLKRDKDDTDKAIYRMCCIGLVEDVTIDYLSETYELKIRKRTDADFKQFMLNFFRKYYSLKEAQKRVDQIDQQKGRNYLDKCLGMLTRYVYENLEKKRFRAIDDMCTACETSLEKREEYGDDHWLKDFIHLYFNSKYARTDYEVDGKPYSLSTDTDIKKRFDFELVLKYIDIISKDSSSSENDNVKHLYGATLMCLRAHEDNPALYLLLAFCIAFLGVGKNQSLKINAKNAYITGFMTLSQYSNSSIWKYVNEFNNILLQKAKENNIKEYLTSEVKEMLSLLIHENKINNLSKKYLNTK